jgi:hypothetical protein
MIYSPSFFKNQKKGSNQSAKEVVPLLITLIHPKNIVDIGCGIGTWLSEFDELNIKDYLGVDGDWVEKDMLLIPHKNFLSKDLQKPLRLKRRFDMVVSLEVAEHIPEQSADIFVRSLTALSDVVVFSAAIPKQGGTNHLNEQWQSYWAEKFLHEGYVAVDYLRPLIWGNKLISLWYKQNVIIYFNKKTLKRYPNLHAVANISSLDIVHPENYLARDIPLKMQIKNKLYKIATGI